MHMHACLVIHGNLLGFIYNVQAFWYANKIAVYLTISETLKEWNTFCLYITCMCSYGYTSSSKGAVCSLNEILYTSYSIV